MSTITSYLSYFKGLFSFDMAVLVVLFIIFLAYTLFFGRKMMISLILAFYPATLLYKTFPFIQKLLVVSGDKFLIINKIVIFLVFLVPLFIIISRYISSESSYTGSSHIIRTVGLAIVGVILILLFSYSTVSLDPIYNFSSSIDILFSTTDRVFWWNLAPLLVLAVL
ncbi:MAG: hypothetical protein A3G47_00605 [Candidatus Zambryskibacteria bacterium RIFCSPLOWO2_12_FULL_39_45]|uniref:Uncharacterized protein n=3 Tax=Candidatus Zambryskiibacteriota TaxID=1817925 RepID=A0A1G2T6K1_9BACT|nr:MAG: hypothetical protein UT81_C0013G0024 [Parcubacteria group bacterium GW2011_GWA2_40_14]OHA92907.1 MAG: hypothetical protein A2W58_00115 [Candidatus Zambryskibacteria bacterium RIFCSPHIGHO2_02_38_10.5]OHA96210.1 MAG: hypothetical protein A3C63_02665 [Candidatus Zambryskibacteria bacterium RIFCSPHIGHO2_02_FULL_39_82]OHA98418.1 MAG: hypothetical protein A3E32_01880 [Candidatus Zambryskibacteria bacterium RIFCSPHIGHO2_12_FULL_38_37]OHB09186.1 MAG: hypothetical protein A2W64_01445 [Candidatus